MKVMVERASIYDYVGGDDAFLALARALNDRCLADPVLNHPFSRPGHPQHLERLAAYLAEVFGGPPAYSELGGHSAMLEQHAGTGADDELPARFLACFDLALDDANFPDDAALRQVLHDYMAWATSEVNVYSPLGVSAPTGLAMPHWTWDGPVTPEASSA
ncbi:MAG TPA: group II truncated hemoglobin [Acidimicrobiales bacterium]|nr:group II truncated hemoglobin [Acidimicrobiales bacterium]